MYKRLQNIAWIRGTNAIGVQISYSSIHSFSLHVISTKRSSGRIHIIEQNVDIKELGELKRFVSQNTPVVITIDGKVVVHKFIQGEVGRNPLDLVLPNAKKDDFYCQVSDVTDGCFISVIRKELIDALLESLASMGVIPARITLGPFCANSTQFLFAQQLVLYSEFWQMQKTGTGITFNEETASKEFAQIGGDAVRNKLVPSFSLAICHLLNIETSEIELFQTVRENFIYKRAIWLLGWGLLGFFFMLLLINFMVFSHYNERLENTNNLLQQHQSLLSRCDLLKKQYAQKRKFIERSGLLQTTTFSFYADRIARIVPSSMQLTAIELSPVEGKVRAGKPVLFNANQVIVSGNCSNASAFSLWKEALKEERWVNDIFINQFGQEDISKPIFFQISLEIAE